MSDSLFDFSGLHLRPDPARTVIKPFGVDYPEKFRDAAHPRVRTVIDRVLSLDVATRHEECETALAALSERHRNVETMLNRRFDEVCGTLDEAFDPAPEEKLLIGAYLSAEYSFEAAALFNPSIVMRMNQDNAPAEGINFILSLRGIGEGHVSSVTFRTGSWCATGGFVIDDPSPWVTSPRIEGPDESGKEGTTRIICEGSEDPSESVLFPVIASQRQGIEDMRMVRFTEEDGTPSFLGTYTAFDGRDARCELFRGTGINTFEMTILKGSVPESKGMALFPRRVDGRYAMIGRQDSENLWLILSDDITTWNGGTKIVEPKYPWEFIQLGNCGSPIEIDEGWLLLTHGVGMMRNYCMGACLLDKDDPSKLLARTAEPILRPSPEERNGYVPNVVYSCGAIVHDRTLLLPFGIADNFASFASCSVDDLLKRMS
ncbi:glycoside hydrolase family 130 protein [Sphingomonas nostoxanthinifaciens]|uniref:glycoside hydrolase family 130 protein n=1 Tax=Sphingomonas nostoxanthinifaciens TaxID=2872652 RepID=UPI001CC1EC18|nr:glycoside hydrolase family 130 protein [Sphingomonas nostoxanthinifaciens]UAK24034.1 glycoside hydrolase family 130 protein [Sphingomonas nostoxanthinifaciens]